MVEIFKVLENSLDQAPAIKKLRVMRATDKERNIYKTRPKAVRQSLVLIMGAVAGGVGGWGGRRRSSLKFQYQN